MVEHCDVGELCHHLFHLILHREKHHGVQAWSVYAMLSRSSDGNQGGGAYATVASRANVETYKQSFLFHACLLNSLLEHGEALLNRRSELVFVHFVGERRACRAIRP